MKYQTGKRLTAFALAVTLLIIVTAPAFASPPMDEYSRYFNYHRLAPRDNTAIADALNHLDIFKGTGSGYELERSPTRIEALVTVIRLVGKEEEALSRNLASTFSDVPDWALPYAGYGQQNGLIYGVGGDKMGAQDTVTAQQYVTMMLRVLGYSDIDGDFEYSGALRFSFDLGMIDDWGLDFYNENDGMIRNDMVYFMYKTLSAVPRSSTYPLIWQLAENGAVSADKAYGTMSGNGEPESEIVRALKNGYSDKWVRDLHVLVEENPNIQSEFKTVFKSCVYNWIKEPGCETGIMQFKSNIYNLTVSKVPRHQEAVFRENDIVMAYYQTPNKIVIRDDLSLPSSLTTISHEFRHAMTSTFDITLIEEGMTEFWNQEVDKGDHGYPYYYVNTAKLITHIIGTRKANESCISGSMEDIYYALELASGINIDKKGFSDNLTKLNYDSYSSTLHEAVTKQLFELIKGYYETNIDSIISQSVNAEYYADTLLALGQMLYYPSSVVQNVDTDKVTGAVSGFYSAEFSDFALAALDIYCQATGYPLSDLEDYYRRSADMRYCVKYMGPDSGGIFHKTGTAYTVYYNQNGLIYYNTFGSFEQAERFSDLVDTTEIKYIDNEAFELKLY